MSDGVVCSYWSRPRRDGMVHAFDRLLIGALMGVAMVATFSSDGQTEPHTLKPTTVAVAEPAVSRTGDRGLTVVHAVGGSVSISVRDLDLAQIGSGNSDDEAPVETVLASRAR